MARAQRLWQLSRHLAISNKVIVMRGYFASMHPSALARYLDQLISNNIKISTMIWGPPGIGKSSIVEQTATRNKIGFIDLRLSQLAPTDLRGLPVADKVSGSSRWFPPEFLPRKGKGILFLDEINMAPPTMQGMAQQLILDRKVGSYVVPDGWFIWAAGNRKEDRATVFEMPAPLGNRFIHLDVSPDLDSFKAYAAQAGLHEQIAAFVTFRPALLHKMEAQQPAWPSPRSWTMANALHNVGLDISPAVGAGAMVEFKAFLAVYDRLPNLEAILEGRASDGFPDEPSVRYATVVGLASRAENATHAYNAYRWLSRNCGPEWLQLCTVDLNRRIRLMKGGRARLNELIDADPELKAALDNAMKLTSGEGDNVIHHFGAR